jgi:hypothetical protein
MIEPYGTIVHSFLDDFAKIGFSKSQESQYSIVFSDGNNSVEVATEKYYHPSLTARLIDAKGKIFSIRLLREILKPDQLKKDSTSLELIKKNYHLDDERADEVTRNQGIAAYVSLAIEQLLGFLSSSKNELSSGSYESKYAAREVSKLKNIGL